MEGHTSGDQRGRACDKGRRGVLRWEPDGKKKENKIEGHLRRDAERNRRTRLVCDRE